MRHKGMRIEMEEKKGKQKKNHIIILTSDAADANVKQFQVKPGLVQGIVIAVCVLVGGILGYFINEKRIWDAVNKKTDVQKEAIAKLEEDKQGLNQQIEDLNRQIRDLETQKEELNDKIAILSDTVNQKTQSENSLKEQIEQQSIPSAYPLTGSATIKEEAQTDTLVVFSASEGNTVVATASGTVTAINDDGEYGHNVWVDHGNGYITIYRNKGEAKVKINDVVAQGTTIFIISPSNTEFGYQIMKDGIYINPMDMLSING